MLSMSSSDDFDGNDSSKNIGNQPYYPPLTDIELENRKAEMILIAQLNHGDTPTISEFQKHWFSERGSDFKVLLTHADLNIGRGMEYWEEAEDIFEELIRQDPTFLEPQARLAKLRCLQGRFDESLTIAQRVLDSKPWHFVTQETMVASYTGKGNKMMADLWKQRKLPTMKRKTDRELWIDRALEDAEVILGRMQTIRRQSDQE